MNNIIKTVLELYVHNISSYIDKIDNIQVKINKNYSPTEIIFDEIILLSSDGVNTNYDVRMSIQPKGKNKNNISKVLRGSNLEDFRSKIQTLLNKTVDVGIYEITPNYVTVTKNKDIINLNINITIATIFDMNKLVLHNTDVILEYVDKILLRNKIKQMVEMKILSIKDISTKKREKYDITLELKSDSSNNKRFSLSTYLKNNKLEKKFRTNIEKLLSQNKELKLDSLKINIYNNKITIQTKVSKEEHEIYDGDGENAFLDKIVPGLTIDEIEDQCKMISNLLPLCSDSGWNSVFQSKYPEWYKLYYRSNIKDDISVPTLLRQLEKIVNIDYIEEFGLYYLLVDAIENRYYDLIKLLLQDPEVDVGAEDDAALRVASVLNDAEAIKILISDPHVNPSVYDNEILNNAIKNKNKTIIRALLDNKRFKISMAERKKLNNMLSRS